MTTMTISVPHAMAKRIDEELRKQGYATRSEFIRTLLRRYIHDEMSGETFTHRPLGEIKLELARTGKYNQRFIESVLKGLSKSSLYAS